MLTNSTIKEHYIKIQELYSNVVNILTAINQSFQSTASEITVSYLDNDDIYKNIRIPSFLYLENKIEQLDTNFTSLFKMPKSGEAWFTKANDMYKLELVKSNNAPVTPILDQSNVFAYSKNTNIFKDLVNPKTFLKIDITNLPDNIEKMMVKKIVFLRPSIYQSIADRNLSSYEEYKAVLYNLTNGVDYEEYDSIIDLPVKQDEYKSEFIIEDIPNNNDENPYLESTTNNLIYKLVLNTLTYSKEEDSSIEYTLHTGQYVCLDNEYVIYKVLEANTNYKSDIMQHEVILEEVLGHVSLQTFEENHNMVLHLYNQDYSKYHYIELPLEENPYVAFFLSTVYNNTRSVLSSPMLLNLNEVKMVDENGQKLVANGKEISYIEYYNKYCQNVGDLLLGFSDVAYSQLSNYTIQELSELQNGDVVQNYVSNTISNDFLKVQRINKHLIDDEHTSKVINLHSKRNELVTNIDNIQSNIDEIYNQLVNTDFENEISTTQLSLKSKLDDLYNEKMIVQKQLISVVDNIDILKSTVYGTSKAKYRIRGNADFGNLENYLASSYNKCNIIQMEVQYKYKSINTDTTNVENINSNLFTDWNKLTTIERERKLVFDPVMNSYSLEYENYNDLTNIIKWNQIEIPISQGEDVIIRVRYKYSIGQPFVNLYTPWSDELTIEFPVELNDNSEISAIIEQNENDEINAKFLKTLINDGYLEHINNKVIDNAQKFYHMPENIYSGFNTPENSFITLKDKLQSMSNDIDKYKEIIQSDVDSSYSIYVQVDNSTYELFGDHDNNITISGNQDNINTDTFISKDLNLIIKNTGVIPLKIYSLFPGNSDKKLIEFNNTNSAANNSRVYENVPLIVTGESYAGQTAYDTVQYQSLGQLLYFRKNSSYDVSSYYLSDYRESQILGSIFTNNTNGLIYQMENYGNVDFPYNRITSNRSFTSYIGTNKQVLMPSRYRNEVVNNIGIKMNKLNFEYNEGNTTNKFSNFSIETRDTNDYSTTNKYIEDIYDLYVDFKKYKYNDNTLYNNFILRYEHIYGKYKNQATEKLVQLDNSIELESILKNDDYTFTKMDYSKNILVPLRKEDLLGGFLVPVLKYQKQITCKENNNSYIIINVGESIKIPLLFQYYLNNSFNKITKTLSFDIKNSLFKSPVNYTFSVTAKYDQTVTTTEMSNL